jgi:MFS family permease
MMRDLVLVAISLFAWGMGEGTFIFFQTITLQRWGAEPVTIGAILGGMGLAMAVAQIPAGLLADRVGRRPMMWISWITGTAAAWIMALAGGLSGFVAGLLLYGLTSFVLAPMHSYITGARGRWSVGRALTLTSAAFNLGAVIGPLLGGQLAEHFGLRTAYMVGASILVGSTTIIMFVHPQPVRRMNDDEAKTRLWHNRGFTGYLLIVFTAIFAAYLHQPLTPNYLQYERGLSLAAIGELGSLSSLGGALIAIGFGRLNAGAAFLIGQALVAVSALLFWRGSHLGWYSLAYFCIGGYRLVRSMTIAQVRPLVRTAEIGLAYGVIETVNGSAIILAPLAAGFLYDHNPLWMYMASLAGLGVSLLAGIWWVGRHWQTHLELSRQIETSTD